MKTPLPWAGRAHHHPILLPIKHSNSKRILELWKMRKKMRRGSRNLPRMMRVKRFLSICLTKD
jgi:hypothetical protein